MSDNDVKIGFALDGLPAALQGIEQLRQGISGLNTDTVVGGGSSRPSGAPGYAPNAPDPYGGHNLPMSAGGIYIGSSSMSIIPPAPVPPVGGSVIGPSTITSGGGSGASVIHASQITIHAQSVVINASSVSYAGGTGAGTAGGTMGGGSTAIVPNAPTPATPPGGVPSPNPPPMPFDKRFQQYYQGVLGQVNQGNLGGAATGAMVGLPELIGGAAPWALGGAALLGVGMYAQSQWRAGTESQAALGYQLSAEALGGRQESAYMQAARRQVAVAQDALRRWQSGIWGHLEGLPLIGTHLTNVERALGGDVAYAQEQQQLKQTEALLTAFGPMGATTFGPTANLQAQIGSSLAGFGSTVQNTFMNTLGPFGRGAFNTGPGGTATSRTLTQEEWWRSKGLNQFLPEIAHWIGSSPESERRNYAHYDDIGVLPSRIKDEVRRAYEQGKVETSGAPSGLMTLRDVNKYSDADIARIPDTASRYFGNPSFADLRSKAFGGAPVDALQSPLIEAAVASGDRQAIRAYPLSAEQRDFQLNRIANIENTQLQGRLTVSQISGAGSRLQYLQTTGAGAPALQEAIHGLADLQRNMRDTVVLLRDVAVQGGDKEKEAFLNAQLQGIDATIAGLQHQYRDQPFIQGMGISTAQTSAYGTQVQTQLYSGVSITRLQPAYAGMATEAGKRAGYIREQLRRPDLAPEQRAAYEAQLQQEQFQADIGVGREYSQGVFGEDISRSRVAGSEAGYAGTRAALFGTPAESRQASLQQAGVIGMQIKNIQDLLSRGLMSPEERNNKQAEIKDLLGKQLEVTTNAYREEASQNLQIAQGRMAIASTQMQTGFMRGVGGTAAEDLSLGYLATAGGGVARAQQQVDLLVRQGEPENSERMVAARQALATAQQQQVGAEIGLANAPALDVTGQRELSRARYQTQVLSMLPGSYGSIRGALRTTVRDLEREGQAKKDQYAEVVKQYGGEENVPEYVKQAFQEQFQNIGLQQAQATQQLSYGWESRLMSQTLGTPGNFGYIANKFTLRDAIGSGVHNPHMGSSGADLPFFLSQGLLGPDIAGSTGTPGGFALTALAGARSRKNGIPGVMGMPGNSGMGGDANHVIQVNIQITNPDGTVNKRKMVTFGSDGANGSAEDKASVSTLMNAGAGQ